MTGKSSGYYEELQGQLRGLLIEVSDQLPSFTLGLVDELIDANECGVALETLSEMLVESGAAISSDTLDGILLLVDAMDLDHANADRLRPLVVEPDDAGGPECSEG